LAEDIHANATLVILRLKQQGHSITWVENGKDAVEKLKKEKFDIILMDIQMPEMDGLEATKIIRKTELNTGNHIPIIAQTASVLHKDQSLCYDADMDAIITKPINFSELLLKMEEWVPEGIGKCNTSVNSGENNAEAKKTSNLAIDFLPLLGIVDYKSGQATWGDDLVYAKALIEFSQNHKDDAYQIKQYIQKPDCNVIEAMKIIHALKGLAGNLSILDVRVYAETIDSFLKNNQIIDAENAIPSLDNSIKATMKAIADLVLPEQETDNRNKKDFDETVVKNLLNDTYTALKALNPDAVLPFIEELADYLEKNKLRKLLRYLDQFDFSGAENELKLLANELNISLN